MRCSIYASSANLVSWIGGLAICFIALHPKRYANMLVATNLLVRACRRLSYCDCAFHAGYLMLLCTPIRRRRYAVTKRREILESESIHHILKTHHRLLLRAKEYSLCSLTEAAL
jgi:hypothetical protein